MSELQEYGTTDGIKFLADPFDISVGQFAYTPLSEQEFSRLYDGSLSLSASALLDTLSKHFPSEKWNRFGRMDWKARKSGESEESYVVEEKNLQLNLPLVYTTKDNADFHSMLAQGLYREGTIRMPSKDFPKKLNYENYVKLWPGSIIAFKKGDMHGAHGGWLRMYGEISIAGYNRLLYEILKPNDYTSCASEKDFYVFGKRDPMYGYITGINVLPALPSKMKKTLKIIKSAWDSKSFEKLEEDISTIDMLESRGHKKQAGELKAELEEKINSIRKNVGI